MFSFELSAEVNKCECGIFSFMWHPTALPYSTVYKKHTKYPEQHKWNERRQGNCNGNTWCNTYQCLPNSFNYFVLKNTPTLTDTNSRTHTLTHIYSQCLIYAVFEWGLALVLILAFQLKCPDFNWLFQMLHSMIANRWCSEFLLSN